MITVTDKVGTSGTVSVLNKDGVTEAIREWYPEAPAEVTDAIERLQETLNRNEYTGELEAFLGIEISES